MPASRRDALLLVVFTLAVTIVMTWPLAPKMAQGGRVDADDGQFAIWNVSWVARTIAVDPANLFDANIFYPRRRTLAFSEPNIGAGVLAMPAYWLSGGNPFLAHNTVALFGFMLSLAGTALLVRYLTGSLIAGFVSGVAFAFCGYTFSHTAHIQLLLSGGLPVSLLMMHRFVDRQTAGRAIALGVVVAAQGLLCGYYGIFAALAIGPGLVFYAFTRGQWRRWQYWAGAAGAGAIAILVVLPFFLPFMDLKATTGFVRTSVDARRWSARWSSYVASPAYVHRWIIPRLPPWGEVAYPGTIATLFGIAGAFLAGRAAGNGRKRDHAVFYTAVAAFMAWASFGPDAGLYSFFHDNVPVFTWISSPSRMAVMVTLALAVLAGFAVARLLERVSRPAVVGTVVVAAAILDVFVAPLPFVEAKPTSPVYRTLAAQQPSPVAEFPFWSRRVEFPRHALYMLNSTAHWHAIVNGYSDFIPPEFRQIAPVLAPFPNTESFALLRRLGVRFVVFHLDLYSPRDRALLEPRIGEYGKYLTPLAVDGDTRLYEITAWP
jgi:hypothetical protein